MKPDFVIVAGVKGGLPGWLNWVVSQWVHDGDARPVSPFGALLVKPASRRGVRRWILFEFVQPLAVLHFH